VTRTLSWVDAELKTEKPVLSLSSRTFKAAEDLGGLPNAGQQPLAKQNLNFRRSNALLVLQYANAPLSHWLPNEF